ncbi:MAG: MBL fold metallo-hydrolase [Anaerolineales bacterium]|nr:MBL fold metallo-hydrolase [Anaerolineales bacterium]
MQLVDNVYQVPGVIANVYVVTDPDGVTLVDTGLPYNHGRIVAYLARLGQPAAAVRRILVTHADRDHMGSVKALQALTGARVYASALEGAAMARGQETRRLNVPPGLRLAFWVLRRFVFAAAPPAAADESLTDGQVLPVLGGLQVLATPGHTPGHVSFYAPAAGVLFAGDSLRVLGGRLRVSSGPNTADAAAAAASASRQLALRPHLICAGHGAALLLG